MEIVYGIVSAAGGCIAQACCWYAVFRWCGCIEKEEDRIVLHTQPRVTNSQNPFLNTTIGQDKHLEPAYR